MAAATITNRTTSSHLQHWRQHLSLLPAVPRAPNLDSHSTHTKRNNGHSRLHLACQADTSGITSTPLTTKYLSPRANGGNHRGLDHGQDASRLSTA
ncbi:Hypothetical predicted protein, partial [Pelobates cultripes]